jgi:hypothetical protein
VDSVGSGQGPVVDSCEHGDEPSGSGAIQLVKFLCVHILQCGTVFWPKYI